MPLNEWSEIGKAILAGKHDENLDQIDQAVKYRKKSMFRVGAKFKLTGTKNPELDGQVCTVIRVNAKRIAVGVGDPVEEYGIKTWSVGEYNVPAHMLVAV